MSVSTFDPEFRRELELYLKVKLDMYVAHCFDRITDDGRPVIGIFTNTRCVTRWHGFTRSAPMYFTDQPAFPPIPKNYKKEKYGDYIDEIVTIITGIMRMKPYSTIFCRLYNSRDRKKPRIHMIFSQQPPDNKIENILLFSKSMIYNFSTPDIKSPVASVQSAPTFGESSRTPRVNEVLESPVTEGCCPTQITKLFQH